MQYLGGKARSANKIIEYMKKEVGTNRFDAYVEPFVGAANVLHKVKCKRKIANDINKYVIAMLAEVSKGWIPPINVSENEYNRIKKNKDEFTDYLVGFVGFGCSFGAKFFGGYARGRPDRNYASVSCRSLLKQAPGLKDVEFLCGSYLELEIPDNSIIYCDPPYEGSTEYHDKNFNSNLFWLWAEEMSKTCKVFVSEYCAPSPWRCIWRREVKVQMNIEGGLKRTDCLFTL